MLSRIKLIMENSGLTPSQFADKIGINRSAISHLLSERNKPSLDIVYKILEAFPHISSNYLLFGSELTNSENARAEDSKVESRDVEIKAPPQKELGLSSLDLTELKKSEKNQERKPEQIVVLFDDGSFKIFHPQA